ncbi:TRADD-N-associated membrane domain-containing protein [Streptomyces olivaceus]|uniref:TRADD-N-associated membrane domain-containing protein n=1 Tax=Streptomyces olivaceus TaxID=47716 RepID=UPI0036EA59BB
MPENLIAYVVPLRRKWWRDWPTVTKLITVAWRRRTASQRRRQHVGGSEWFTVLLLFFTIGTAAYSTLSDLIPELPPTVWAGIGGFVASLIAGFVVTVLRLQRREAQEIQAGRERVRSAERNLEAALRTERSPGASSIEVSGDLVLLPHQSETEGGEGANPPDAERNQGLEGRPAPSHDPSGEAEARTPTTSPRLTLPELWTVTHTRLDLYHDIATGQARRSFRNAQAAMITGFVLLIVFVAVALQASTTAGSVVAGGLGAVSAALSGFVARTFVKSQETAAAHLRAYFDQPLEFSRYLAAERLIADSALTEEQRAEALTALVQAMVTPPAATTGPGQGIGTPGQADQG